MGILTTLGDFLLGVGAVLLGVAAMYHVLCRLVAHFFHCWGVWGGRRGAGSIRERGHPVMALRARSVAGAAA
jgi:hypothetical protein